jgi:arachidonate 15-lipoxygenase
MSFENARSIVPQNNIGGEDVKRGAVDPSLPQNDSLEERAERRQQIAATCAEYQWTCDIPALPGVPLATHVPSDDQP